jgi:glycine/sarcosine N-methyltransferase
VASADDSQVLRFYDEFADDYHLAYAGHWEAAMERQAKRLHELIQAAVPGAASVLDCSCGIGTQAIGLARIGYRVVGSDISVRELERARREAARLSIPVTLVAADFRDLSHVDGSFDVVISCDNAVPHLLAAPDVARALRAMWSKLRPGGLLLITMRDFDQAFETRPPSASPPVASRDRPVRFLSACTSGSR